jgi:hypothetical protein
MTSLERSVYTLAENLHMTVGEMTSKMSVAEYIGWTKFSEHRTKEMAQSNPGKGGVNLIDSPQAVLKSFGL